MRAVRGADENEEPVTRYAADAVAYQVIGNGPIDLLVAPGFLSHLDLNWTMPPYVDFIRGLARFARVIVFDKRGTGLSEPSEAAATFDQRMEDIELVMDAAGVERGVLFGMSEGGPLATLYAASHPDRVNSLVLYGTFAKGSAIPKSLLDDFERAVDSWGSGITADIFLDPQNSGPVVKRFTGLLERAATSPRLARQLVESIRTADVVDVLTALHIPTLVLHRRDDPFAMGQWSDEVADLMPDAHLEVIEGTDHLPWMGNAQEVLAHIEKFVVGEVSNSVPHKLLRTILFTDIVNSTQQAVELGDRAWADVLRAHNAIVRDLFARFDGVEIKNTGDGFFAAFTSPGKAVRCARAIAEQVPHVGVDVRCGLHAGECESIDVADLAGITVHIGARVNGAAEAGQVLATTSVLDLTKSLDLRFEPVGQRRLKGLPSSIELYALVTDDANGDPAGTSDASRSVLTTLDRATLALAKRAPRAVRRLAELANR